MYFSAVFCAAVTVLLCLSYGQCTDIVLAISYFGVKQGDGSDRNESRRICTENGGYLPSDISATHHNQLINTAHNLGVSSEWYAYMGGDTYSPDPRYCSGDIFQGGKQDDSCGWHWHEGQWLYLTDYAPYGNIPHAGILFYYGNKYKGKDQRENGFPSFFPEGDPNDVIARPGYAFGRSLLLVGQGTEAIWSDNVDTGGYVYKNAHLQSKKLVVDTASMSATKSLFVTLCEVQPMHRETYELFNTSSHIQENWWAVFFVIFFVIALVGFIVTAACQEREDMDEPPEDAPEWAAKQQSSRHSKSFISTRSFRQYDDDNGGNATREETYGAERADSYVAQDRQHSFREGDSQNPFVVNQGYEEQVSHHPSMRDNWM